jgi:hypothetical protein
MSPYCTTYNIYVLWNATILYDPRYLRTLECHHIVWPTISTYSGMPPYCTIHDIYKLYNATILYDPRYLRTLECHHIVRPTISTNSGMSPYCTTHDIYELWNATISDDVHVASSNTTGATNGTVNHSVAHEFLVF